MSNPHLIYFCAGALGAMAKDIIKDNTLSLPKLMDGKFYLGFIGGAVTGGIAGMIIDGSPVTAFMAGFTGTAIFENLLNHKPEIKIASKEGTEDLIRRIAIEEKIDPDLAVRVARCESGLKPEAINKNSNGTTDRGLFQINDYWHKNVSDAQAFDPEFSTRYFCERVRKGFLSDWNASKHCWNK